jgi:ribonuclease HI
VGEVAAIIKATTTIPTFWPLIIKTDSKYAIKGLMTYLRNWQNTGWIGIKNANLFKKAAYLLRRCTSVMSQ